MALVSNVEMHEAWHRWSEVWGQEAPFSFYDFLEGTLETKANTWVWEVSDTAAERIRLVASSPYYKTLLKAWAVQRASMEVTG